MTRHESIQRLKRQLIQRRRQLLDLMSGELSQHHNSDDPIGGDLVDLAVEADYVTVNSALAATECQELEQIHDALRRFDDGTFGFCCDCGKPISIARLRAIPYAVNCVACKIRDESEQQWFKLSCETDTETPDTRTSLYV
ncbi:RNA polymerase-binding transcription factor [Novipirellula aureliae]|uniref:RNA polymerase-binding transcription factor n=1 Tax=Novipirellula aureliae TaxID=2527966 RepID=A0A5C6E754_9BACT|nr:TraR/DksA family transcriptional regulator [Novipirellula aureliae]TWU43491.1 RNA polymerase-binding transcription factor [Novipirellula aureliae]